ncbi:hypothetical protein KIPB_002671 [Kipferlia bialata]|uniref:Uncharacterized protein n=1 Tax=Kipferlia bialata TaxID=797122 RepID=A0A9K3CRS7_9EUKA|nr:hypothetical protein KIPB_002671 [Kipferlia bialata]|eukprot:g2671.t1
MSRNVPPAAQLPGYDDWSSHLQRLMGCIYARDQEGVIALQNQAQRLSTEVERRMARGDRFMHPFVYACILGQSNMLDVIQCLGMFPPEDFQDGLLAGDILLSPAMIEYLQPQGLIPPGFAAAQPAPAPEEAPPPEVEEEPEPEVEAEAEAEAEAEGSAAEEVDALPEADAVPQPPWLTPIMEEGVSAASFDYPLPLWALQELSRCLSTPTPLTQVYGLLACLGPVAPHVSLTLGTALSHSVRCSLDHPCPRSYAALGCVASHCCLRGGAEDADRERERERLAEVRKLMERVPDGEGGETVARVLRRCLERAGETDGQGLKAASARLNQACAQYVASLTPSQAIPAQSTIPWSPLSVTSPFSPEVPQIVPLPAGIPPAMAAVCADYPIPLCYAGPLHDAVARGDVEQAMARLSRTGPRGLVCVVEGVSLLSRAVLGGDPSVVQAMLQAGCSNTEGDLCALEAASRTLHPAPLLRVLAMHRVPPLAIGHARAQGLRHAMTAHESGLYVELSRYTQQMGATLAKVRAPPRQPGYVEAGADVNGVPLFCLSHFDLSLVNQ